MYVGAGTALFGAALYYQSLWLSAYGVGFLAVMHLFVVFYEEPALRSAFGPDYEEDLSACSTMAAAKARSVSVRSG